MKGSYAQLIEESPFAAEFERGVVPIKGIIASRAVLEGSLETECYLTDFARCTPEQIEAIVTILAERSGFAAAGIREEILRVGLPIRASQVRGVSTDLAFFL